MAVTATSAFMPLCVSLWAAGRRRPGYNPFREQFDFRHLRPFQELRASRFVTQYVMKFEDHFSRRARDYARYRPSYPPELFAYLASAAPGRSLAWDCGTGSGQAALGLAKHFERIVATDASAEQIEHALFHDRVEYRVALAESTDLDDGSVDLCTVAIAVHWFDLDAFYREVRRVLKTQGIVAVWTYHLPSITPEVDRAVLTYYADVLGDFWPERFQYVDERYRTLPFPFDELEAPEIAMTTEWDLNEMLGFLDSWSAARRYVDERGHHPIERVWDDLAPAWGEASVKRSMAWPIHMKVGSAGS